MSKPTPGPWIATGNEVRQPAGRMVAYTGPHHTPEAEYPLACKLEDEANARLITAAPELLAACLKLQEAYTDGDRHFHRLADEAMIMACAAIAKAIGEIP